MLAGFASNPWDYALAPKPRTGGTIGKPFVNPAVANLLQAPELVPMGQPAVTMLNGQAPRPNTKPAVVSKPMSPANAGAQSGSLAALIQQLLAMQGTDPVTQTQIPYGSPPWMPPSNPVTKPYEVHGLAQKVKPSSLNALVTQE